MMQLGIAMMTSVVPTAPLPAILPDYSIECRAGEMTGGKMRLKIGIAGQAGARTAEIDEGAIKWGASVEPQGIPLASSVGGIGFVDMIKFQRDGRNGFMMIEVRGPVEDDLISFFTTSWGPKKPMRGSCNLTTTVQESTS
jgi:hypothetical protein